MNVLFSKYQYREAKAFLQDAEVVGGITSPQGSELTYLKDGRLYFEYDSKLEAPEDEYYVVER